MTFYRNEKNKTTPITIIQLRTNILTAEPKVILEEWNGISNNINIIAGIKRTKRKNIN